MVAEFAATLTNPIAAALVLVAAFVLERPWPLRLTAVVVGGLMAAPDLLRVAEPLPGAQILLAAIAATLLQAEICLHFVLPAWRLTQAIHAWITLRARLLLGRLPGTGNKQEG